MKKKRFIAGAVAILLVIATCVQVFSRTGPFTLNFSSSGSAAHPDISLSNGDQLLCLLNGGSAHSGYQYYQDDNEIDYFSGSMEQKRLFWAYVMSGRRGSLYNKETERLYAHYKDYRISNEEAKRVAWSRGAAGVSAKIDYLAENGFMTLKEIPDGCKSANDIYKMISVYDSPEHAMGMNNILKGPGTIDSEALYTMMGLSSMEAYKKYTTIEPVNNANCTVSWDDYFGWRIHQNVVVAGQGPIVFKVKYDPTYFQVIKAEGKLRYYTCAVNSSQPMYQAGGSMEMMPCEFYMVFGKGYTPDMPPTTTTNPDETTTGGDMGDVSAPEVKVYQHRETFESNYNAELTKKDYETANPLKDSVWEVDEKFDDSQLSTDETEQGIVQKYMREAPTTWKDWLICTNDLTTDEDGHLTHTDTRYYDFQQTYCNGHPLPPEPEGDDEEDDDAYEEAMEAWQEMVDECAAKANASAGHMHHWLCGSEEEPSEAESFEQSGCKAARDATYQNFINLEYSYTFREVKARDGYILHFVNGHKDDVPIEIMTTAASEAGKEAKWTSCNNSDIVTSGYRQNYVGDGAEEASMDDKVESAAYTIDVIEERPKTFWDEIASRFGFETVSETRYTIEIIPVANTATDSETDELDEEFEDYEIVFDDYDIATSSNASAKNVKYITDDVIDYYSTEKLSSDEESGEDENEDSEEVYDTNEAGAKFLDEGAIVDSQPGVKEGPHDKLFHSWIVYDHRVEGEIHFNKRDLDLKDKEDDFYSAYADANGDGTLEGAVYGLFAADPIYHPDTQRDNGNKGSGIIFDANDLVAVATTDRNGDASFMSITEKPHSTYNYENGKIEYSGKAYPKNLYDDDTYRKEYDNEEMGRVYTDNVIKNGDYWIGRPLILGNYYIKELSRSEGYELSINGKDMAYTNGQNTEYATNPQGEAWIQNQLYFANTLTGENTQYGSDNLLPLTTASKGTTQGYNIVLDGLPEDGIKIKQINHGTIQKVESVPVGGAWVDATEEPLYQTATTVSVKKDQNGNVIANPEAVEYPAVYGGYATEIKKVMNPDASVTPENAAKYNAPFNEDNLPYIKYETESMLRQLGMETPKAGAYSTEAKPVYDGKTETAYGRPEIIVTINNAVSNKDVINGIIEYYRNNPSYSYGGVQKIVENGNSIKVTLVVCTSPNKSFVYETDDSGNIIAVYLYKLNTTYGRYVLRKYSSENFTAAEKNKTMYISVYPDFTVSATGEVTDLHTLGDMSNQYLCYEIGDILYDYWYEKDGSWVGHEPIRRQVYEAQYEDQIITEDTEEPVEITVVESADEIVDSINQTYAIYDAETKQYTIHVAPSEETDAVMETEFVIELPSGSTTLTDADIRKLGGEYNTLAYQTGDSIPNCEYIVAVQGAGASVYVAEMANVDTSYVKNANLIYNGQLEPQSITNGIKVLERPIRQRIKVTKSILTNPDGTYEHDTYGKVMDTEAVDKMDNFRFKSYLKSNLERLYRDDNGDVKWLDRNGNELVPEYRDTNGDGNYDTFVWKTEDGSEIDFPEYDKDMNADNTFTGKLSSTNVQKLYTKVSHNPTAMATGDIENNVDTGSVIANDELYSYDGVNTNVGMTDRINVEQNSGYTRLLESIDKIVEDGAGKTREIRSYNYEKFFAAVDTANKDKWDDDMHTTFTGTGMTNYPGQHWEETFYEMYQKDDADAAHTIENTDGADKDNTAGGDRDKSFKPFAWIREHIFKQNGQEKDYYNGTANNDYIENIINTSDYARANAEASDAVRQFAIDWYLKDEAAKLVELNGTNENQAKTDRIRYSNEIYDEALFNAIMKSYNYLKPFYQYDLDTMYAVPWDTAENGGADNDYTTLSADILYENGDAGYYYGISSYLPYGTYVTREVQPADDQLDDFANKHYKIDTPKEIELPSIYNADGQMNEIYNYDHADTPETLASKYHIRFNEEWSDNHTDDLRNYIIRAHNHDGDYEIYKYGLDIDKIFKTRIDYDGRNYTSDGFNITQDEFDPLKNYYNSPIVDVEKDGGNVSSHYHADDKNIGKATANGTTYAENAIERRYHYGSISEDQGTANNVLYPNGPDRDDNNPTGFYFKDDVVTMVGNQTAYQDKYAPMLVPWTVTEPVTVDEYNADDFNGYADVKFRNTFYVTKLRIEKLDSETGENILHDDAIFAIYGAERYTSTAEIRQAVDTGIYGIYPDDYPQIGDVKVYTKDTTISGSLEFLEGMKASNIQKVRRAGAGELYSGVVLAGTPICKEEDQIVLTDFGTIKDGLIYKNGVGERTGDFKAFSTLNEVLVADEEGNGKVYADQNTGYFITPAPVGAGTYVLVEMKAPSGYVRTDPVAVEVYSDSVEYYKDGDRFSKVPATVYTENIIK